MRRGTLKAAWAWLAPPALAVALAFAPGPRPLAPDGAERTVLAEIASADDSALDVQGLLEYGTQRLVARLDDGRELPAVNELRAQLELDKKFAPGDTALVTFPAGWKEGDALVARDHWRLGRCAALFALFAAFLAWFGGRAGFMAAATFFTACLAVWKILVPAVLAGWSAQWAAFATASALAAAIAFPVAPDAKTGACAFAGSMLGIAVSLALSGCFAALLHVDGATMPFAQQVYYAGTGQIDLRDLFAGASVLAASGAVMDLGMDVASAQAEVARHNPSLGFAALFASGRRVGRAVLGTMSTTLLLAYSGGYLAMLLSFAASGAEPKIFLNSPLVAAEAAKTLAGSFGLALTAPLAALAGAWTFRSKTWKTAKNTMR